jgi:hypothetical protein
MFRFRIRDVLWLTVVVGLGVRMVDRAAQYAGRKQVLAR